MSKSFKTYRYYDSPDGEDTLKKLWAILKPTTMVGISVSTADVMMYSHPKGYLKTLGRFAYFTLPIMGIATTFVVVTNLTTSLRKKQEPINWFIGGAAAGSLCGPWKGKPIYGFHLALAFGIVAALKKYCDIKGYAWIKKPLKQTYGGPWTYDLDWSYTEERPRNWTTSK